MYDIDISDASHNSLDQLGTLKELGMKTRDAAVAGLQRAGEFLWLQLLFLLASLPVITAVPAAVALQRSIQRLSAEGGSVSAAQFAGEFGAAWKRFWLLGLLAPPAAAGAAVSALLWAAAPAPFGALGLGLLIPLAVLAAAAYLVFLGTGGDADRSEAAGPLLGRAGRALLGRPVPAVLAALALAAWLAVLMKVPTLALAGSGLVPALLAWLAVRGADPSRKERSE
jgi:hypothetical protein